jgi:hypothetical protein
MFEPPLEHRLEPRSISSRCRSARAATDTRGGPSSGPGAGDRVEHPRRDDRDHAGRHLDVLEAAGETILAAVPPDAPPAQRMPAVVNHDLLPDMGRMTP